MFLLRENQQLVKGKSQNIFSGLKNTVKEVDRLKLKIKFIIFQYLKNVKNS